MADGEVAMGRTLVWERLSFQMKSEVLCKLDASILFGFSSQHFPSPFPNVHPKVIATFYWFLNVPGGLPTFHKWFHNGFLASTHYTLC